jgi:hypothetical protein
VIVSALGVPALFEVEMRRWFGWLAASVLLSCAKPVLTDTLRERYSLDATDLRRVQLYTSDEIVLRREDNDQEKSISGSGLRIRDGVRLEEVVIRAHTPCVALRVEGPFVLVGFSPQRPDLSLWFGLDKKGDAPAEGRRYELAALANAPNDATPFVPEHAKGFLVTYGGKKYRVADPRSWSAHLLVDLEQSFARDRVRQEAPGWRLTEKSGSVLPLAPGAANPSAAGSASGSSDLPAADAGASP